jgi:uncharacterized membrane protein YeaQ/YmgE (transglycosylase-associated protein family)
MLILLVIVVGMAAGWAAHLLLGGGRRVDWTQVFLVGTAGSFVGGLLFSLLAGDGLRIRPSGLIGSIVGAVIVLAISRIITGRRVRSR